MKKLIISTIAFLIMANLYGQSEEIFLQQLRDKYATVSSLHAKMTVSREDAPDEQVEIWFDPRHSKIITGDMEMMLNDSWFVMVDKAGKMINLQKRAAAQPLEAMARSYQLPIDSLLGMSNHIVVDTLTTSSAIAVHLDLNHPLLDQMTITTDLSLNLRSVRYQLHGFGEQLSQMHVRYTTFDTKPKLTQTQFALAQYVRFSNQAYEPTSAYRGYQVNQIASTYPN